MSKWDKMDKLAWEKSEVAQEFEKYILETAARFEYLALQQKKASGLTDLAQESEAAHQSISQTTESVERLDTALDSISNAEDNISNAEDEEDLEEEKQAEAKKSLIEELTKQAWSAADSGDTILAYKIERAIEEIEEA